MATATQSGMTSGTHQSRSHNSYKAMREMIAGRITKTMKDEEDQPFQRSAAEIIAEAILDGMLGKLVITQGENSTTSLRTGNVNANIDPCPSSLLTQILPPCSSTNFRDGVNPQPRAFNLLRRCPYLSELLEHRLLILGASRPRCR